MGYSGTILFPSHYTRITDKLRSINLLDLTEAMFEDERWMELAQDRVQCWADVSDIEPSSSGATISTA